MVVFSGNKPLVLKECGYPTGPALQNSPASQVVFFEALFSVWDQHHDRIPYLVISRMFDGVRSNCEKQAKDYNWPGEAFIQLLCTLGLRTVDDRAKPAWSTLVQSATARKF